MIISFILACLTIYITITKLINNKKDLKTKIIIILIGEFFAIFFLTIPLFKYHNIIIKILNAFYFAIKSIWSNQDVTIVENIDITYWPKFIYYILLNALFITMPIFATSTILAVISDIFTIFRFNKVKNNNLHIFSEINEKAENLAQKIIEKNDINTSIIYANSKGKNSKTKGIKIEESITDIDISNNKTELKFYVLSSSEDDNINITLRLIEKYKNRENVTIYVLNNDINTPIIFDSIDKGEVILEIINEVERNIFNLLVNKPLYENTINNTISLLIIGCGKVGSEFLRDATWCSVLPEYNYKSTIIDINADKIKEQIEIDYPELLNNYNITFIKADYKSHKTIDIIKDNKDINYILVSMDSNEKNLDAAILLRQQFLKLLNRKPIINIWCSDNFKNKQINNLVANKKLKYDINAFGSNNEMYSTNLIVDSKVERLAKQIHLAYAANEKDKNLDKKIDNKKVKKEYNESEYNKRSSRAVAVHIKYKLYHILKDKFTDDMTKNQELFKSTYNNKIEEELASNEHDRWNAYERSIGYSYVPIDKVKKYFNDVNHYENRLTKEHPAIVDNKNLDNISKELNKLKPDTDLKANDIKIVKALIDGKINL